MFYFICICKILIEVLGFININDILAHWEKNELKLSMKFSID